MEDQQVDQMLAGAEMMLQQINAPIAPKPEIDVPSLVRQEVQKAMAGLVQNVQYLAGPPGRDGRADPAEVQALVQRHLAALPVPRNGRDGRDGKDGQDGKIVKTYIRVPGVDGTSVAFSPYSNIAATNLQDALREEVDDLAASTGSSLLGFLQSGSGAITSTVQTEIRALAVNAVTQFGLSTSGTGSANRTALASAITAAGSTKAVYIPGGNYSIDPSGGQLSFGGKIFGDGRNVTILTITGNGNFLARPSYSTLEDLTIDLAGATYSGDACTFANSSAYQVDRSISIKNAKSGNYALNFAGGGGSQFNSFGCNYHTLATSGSDAAVKVTGSDASATPRTFHGTNGDGCTVWDVGACNDFFIYGGFTNSILFSSSSAANVFIEGLRVGSISGTVTIKGGGHQIIGCDFADPVILDSSTSGVTFACAVPSYNITDNGTTNLVYTGNATYTVSWTGSVSNPAIGDGSILGRYSRSGRRISVDIDLEVGGTTTMGSGTWFFSLPQLDESASGVIQVGSGYVKSAGTFNSCVVVVQPGLQKISVLVGGATTVTNAAPGAWADEDFIRVHVDYLAA